MINFNNFQIRKKTYGGANGNKVSIVINDELYMLKLPQKATKNECSSIRLPYICNSNQRKKNKLLRFHFFTRL